MWFLIFKLEFFIIISEEEKLKNLEKNVSQLAEESCFAAEENDKQAVRSSISFFI